MFLSATRGERLTRKGVIPRFLTAMPSLLRVRLTLSSTSVTQLSKRTLARVQK